MDNLKAQARAMLVSLSGLDNKPYFDALHQAAMQLDEDMLGDDKIRALTMYMVRASKAYEEHVATSFARKVCWIVSGGPVIKRVAQYVSQR